MSVTIVATAGAANANSFLILAEAQAYWDSRLWVDKWDNSDDQNAALVWATRTLCALLSPYKYLVPADGSRPAYYRTRPTWTGLLSNPGVQALPWPRVNMYDRNGVAIPSNVVPQELKDATAELAGALSKTDRTEDNDVITQGITSVKAGSVAVAFKTQEQGILTTKILPDSVLFLLVPSWLTDEVVDQAQSFLFGHA